jgi:putative tryptophan/tyrosine transport system substrate-binding protein
MASHIKRRKFLATLGGAVAWPLAARAQQGERMRRIGVLMPFVAGDPEAQARSTVFAQTLQQLGWTVGRNLQIDYRFAGGEADSIRQYAAELVALAPDVIMAVGNITVAPSTRLAPASSRVWRDQAVMPRGSLTSNTA